MPQNLRRWKQQLAGYNLIVGGLQYLANNTYPNIAHSVNHLVLLLINLSYEHMQAARRVLRFIAAISW